MNPSSKSKGGKPKKKVKRKHLIGWYGHMMTCWCIGSILNKKYFGGRRKGSR